MKPYTYAIAASAALAITTASQAAILAEYAFTGGSAVRTTADPDVNAGNFTAAGGNAGFSVGGNNVFLRSQHTGADQTAALADTDFFSVTISATNVGETMNLSSLALRLGSTERLSAGTAFNNRVYLQSSVGGVGSGNPIIAGTNTTFSHDGIPVPSDLFNPLTTTFDLSGIDFQGLSSVTFQFRFSDNADSTDQINRMDDVTIHGTLVPEPSAALLGSLGLLALLRRRRN